MSLTFTHFSLIISPRLRNIFSNLCNVVPCTCSQHWFPCARSCSDLRYLFCWAIPTRSLWQFYSLALRCFRCPFSIFLLLAQSPPPTLVSVSHVQTILQLVPLLCCAVFSFTYVAVAAVVVNCLFWTDSRVGLAHFLFMLIPGKRTKSRWIRAKCTAQGINLCLQNLNLAARCCWGFQSVASAASVLQVECLKFLGEKWLARRCSRPSPAVRCSLHFNDVPGRNIISILHLSAEYWNWKLEIDCSRGSSSRGEATRNAQQNCNWINELENAHNNEASPRTKDAISRQPPSGGQRHSL